MNILTDTLPERVKVGKSVFHLNTDFRAGIAFELSVDDGKTSAYDIIAPYFPDGFPDDIDGAIEAVLWFFRCGKEQKEESKGSEKQGYSFRVDAEAIYSDFWRFYNIDLSRANIHWWVFRALLSGLPEKSNFKQRVFYRTCSLSGLPKKEKDRISKIRSQIAIEKSVQRKTLEERNLGMKEYIKRRTSEMRRGEIDGRWQSHN